jgi:hypothetical protein
VYSGHNIVCYARRYIFIRHRYILWSVFTSRDVVERPFPNLPKASMQDPGYQLPRTLLTPVNKVDQKPVDSSDTTSHNAQKGKAGDALSLGHLTNERGAS